MDVPWRDLTLADDCVRKPGIRLYQTDYTLGPLDPDELDIFNMQTPTLLAPPTSIERMIQLQRLDAVMYGLRAIKQKLNNPKFRGLNPSNTELGYQPIRPQFTQIAGVYRTNWIQAGLVANTWTNYLSAAAGTGYVIGRDFGIVVTHIKSHQAPAPIVSELQMTEGRTALLPITVRAIRQMDNENGMAIYPIPTIIGLPTSTLFMQIKADAAGGEELELGGYVVGLGRVLAELAPTWT